MAPIPGNTSFSHVSAPYDPTSRLFAGVFDLAVSLPPPFEETNP